MSANIPVNWAGVKYSTDEQVVGTWIDGKPIYQKTIKFSNSAVSISHTNWYNTGISCDSVDNYISCMGYNTTSAGNHMAQPLIISQYNSSGTYYILNARSSETLLDTFTVQYTKITDMVGE